MKRPIKKIHMILQTILVIVMIIHVGSKFMAIQKDPNLMFKTYPQSIFMTFIAYIIVLLVMNLIFSILKR